MMKSENTIIAEMNDWLLSNCWFCWTERGLESSVSSYWCRDGIDQMLTKYDYTDYTDAAPDLVARNKDSTEKVSALVLKLLCGSQLARQPD